MFPAPARRVRACSRISRPRANSWRVSDGIRTRVRRDHNSDHLLKRTMQASRFGRHALALLGHCDGAQRGGQCAPVLVRSGRFPLAAGNARIHARLSGKVGAVVVWRWISTTVAGRLPGRLRSDQTRAIDSVGEPVRAAVLELSTPPGICPTASTRLR